MSVLLKMQHIVKRFPGVRALSDAQFELKIGEVHALLGENGAGKSTLIKVLGGIYQKDEGQILINDKEVEITDVESARRNGISIIHQELMMLPHMSVVENIFLGQELTKGKLLDKTLMMSRAKEMLDSFGLDVPADIPLGHLPIAQQQIVEIVRAISFGAKIIVMDEPTSSLSEKEVTFLFEAIQKLKEKNVGIIYISHRMSELDEISDRITIMRDGQYVDTVETKITSKDELISKMVGRKLDNYYANTHKRTNDVILEVKNYQDGKDVHDVSFNLHKGEILGFAGLIGAGRSEVMECIFGLKQRKGGSLLLNGKSLNFKNPQEAMRNGLALVPEDRKAQALYMQQDISFNMTIEILRDFLNNGFYKRSTESQIVNEYVNKLSIKISSPAQLISGLSGGNQQKVILGRWLATDPKILILDEPTRGVDVGAKAEIYQIIDKLAARGIAIIMISSELPEIIGMSDRVAVMCNGYLTGILEHEEATQEKIMTLATTNF